MGKKNRAAVQSQEALDGTQVEGQETVTETTEVDEIISEEVIAAKAKLADLELQRKALNKAIAECKAIIDPKAESAKVVRGVTFVIPEGTSETIKNKKGGALTFQARWILDNMVIGKGEVGSELTVEGEALAEAVKEFPTNGDIMNNFRWICNQILKPVGIVKA